MVKEVVKKIIDGAFERLQDEGLIRQKYDGTYDATPGIQENSLMRTLERYVINRTEQIYQNFKSNSLKEYNTENDFKTLESMIPPSENKNEKRNEVRVNVVNKYTDLDQEKMFKGFIAESIAADKPTCIDLETAYFIASLAERKKNGNISLEELQKLLTDTD